MSASRLNRKKRKSVDEGELYTHIDFNELLCNPRLIEYLNQNKDHS